LLHVPHSTAHTYCRTHSRSNVEYAVPGTTRGKSKYPAGTVQYVLYLHTYTHTLIHTYLPTSDTLTPSSSIPAASSFSVVRKAHYYKQQIFNNLNYLVLNNILDSTRCIFPMNNLCVRKNIKYEYQTFNITIMRYLIYMYVEYDTCTHRTYIFFGEPSTVHTL
jgi:hypothetical protein